MYNGNGGRQSPPGLLNRPAGGISVRKHEAKTDRMTAAKSSAASTCTTTSVSATAVSGRIDPNTSGNSPGSPNDPPACTSPVPGSPRSAISSPTNSRLLRSEVCSPTAAFGAFLDVGAGPQWSETVPEDRKKAAAARSWLQSREGPARAATGLVGLLRRCDAALVVARRLQSANDQGSLGRSAAAVRSRGHLAGCT